MEGMRYEKIKNLESKEFRRLTEAKPKTFKKMVEMLWINSEVCNLQSFSFNSSLFTKSSN